MLWPLQACFHTSKAETGLAGLGLLSSVLEHHNTEMAASWGEPRLTPHHFSITPLTFHLLHTQPPDQGPGHNKCLVNTDWTENEQNNQSVRLQNHLRGSYVPRVIKNQLQGHILCEAAAIALSVTLKGRMNTLMVKGLTNQSHIPALSANTH